MSRIYLSPPHLGELERRYVLDAIESNWIAPLGPHVDAFEREFCERLGCAHALALSSGTAALHLALQVLGVGPGDQVAVSTLTFVATANAVRYLGAVPVFIDAEPSSWNLDPAQLERALDERPIKAVIAVDLYGQCANYAELVPVCARRGVPLIEDAAEALGATFGDTPAGRLGALGVFSFNGNKIITCSGGGMLISEDGAYIERARHLATQAREPMPHYEHRDVGYNYRLSNILAAVGRAQLQVLDERVRRRREINALYRELLQGAPGIELMPTAPHGTPTHWLTCILIDPDRARADRETTRLRLEQESIEARPVWKPMHLQPVYADAPAYGGHVAAGLFAHGLCLPSGSSLRDEDVHRIARIVRGE